MPALLPEHLVNSKISANLPRDNAIFTMPGLLPLRAFEQLDVEDFAYTIDYYLKKYNKEIVYLTDYPETFEPRFMNFIHAVASKLLDKYNIAPENIKYVCGAWPIQENINLYDQHCLENKWMRVPIILSNYFEFNMAEHIRNTKHDLSNIDKIKKSKIFLCMNGGGRPHRVYLMTYLYKNKLLDKSYFSMHMNLTNIWFILKHININDEWYKDFKRLLEFFYNNKPPMPMILSLKPNDTHGQHIISKDDIKLFADSHISIINETSFFKKDFLEQGDLYNAHLDSIFLTEKTFRTIACQHPFIMVSRPHTLKHMRRLGYKTFSPYIDESYDDIEDDYKRLQKICQIIKELSNKNQEFWKHFQSGVREITLYNYNHLLTRQHYFLSDDNYSSCPINI